MLVSVNYCNWGRWNLTHSLENFSVNTPLLTSQANCADVWKARAPHGRTRGGPASGSGSRGSSAQRRLLRVTGQRGEARSPRRPDGTDNAGPPGLLRAAGTRTHGGHTHVRRARARTRQRASAPGVTAAQEVRASPVGGTGFGGNRGPAGSGAGWGATSAGSGAGRRATSAGSGARREPGPGGDRSGTAAPARPRALSRGRKKRGH